MITPRGNGLTHVVSTPLFRARPQAAAALGAASVPSRNPFLKRRGRSLRWRMRPVPVVLRRMALLDQLSGGRGGGEGGEEGVGERRKCGGGRDA